MLLIVSELLIVVLLVVVGTDFSSKGQEASSGIFFLVSLIALNLIYNLYAYFYYRSKKFLNIKDSIR